MSEAPKVTADAVEAAIVGEPAYVVMPDRRTTICQLTLDNDFTVRGESSCVSLANFNAQMGREIALKNAKDKVWMLLGFRLADTLATARKAQSA